MRQFVGYGLALALAASLAACSSSGGDHPQKVSSTAPSVVYSYEGDHLDQATDKANEYCGGYGQKAKLRDLSTQGGQHFASYDCR
jgi:hypothetical protein